ncbi:hypothetical protein OKW40_007140 [Paraburkholderia sp. RAU6.4a]
MVMSNILSNWIYMGSNAYDAYTFVPWLKAKACAVACCLPSATCWSAARVIRS